MKVVYGKANSAETHFIFIPKSQIIETTENFEVIAGDSGTFDIKYTIKGGTVEDIVIDPQIFWISDKKFNSKQMKENLF